jgi:general secretion pathway protein B
VGPRAAAAPAPPRAEPRVINFEQLPEDVRRAIPPVAIGGAIYSDNAASRMLIVGGQLLHEGDSAAPGVRLEQIKPRSAVLRWKDLRYEVNF